MSGATPKRVFPELDCDVVRSAMTNGKPASSETGTVLAASFETPSPALTERCLAALQAFIARAGGGAAPGAVSDIDQGVFGGFDTPLRAARCAVRAAVEIRKLSGKFDDQDVFALRIGLATGADAHIEAARLRDAAAPGEILAAPDIIPTIEGRLDFDKVDVTGRSDATGRPIDAYALTPSLTGQVFRYMPWTSPRKRQIGLAVAAALMLIAALGLLFDQG